MDSHSNSFWLEIEVPWSADLLGAAEGPVEPTSVLIGAFDAFCGRGRSDGDWETHRQQMPERGEAAFSVLSDAFPGLTCPPKTEH